MATIKAIEARSVQFSLSLRLFVAFLADLPALRSTKFNLVKSLSTCVQ